MNLAEALGGPARVIVTFYQPNIFSGAKDRSRIAVLVPVMVWERAEKLLALLAEHGAVEEWGVMVAAVARCEAIGTALSRAGFEVVVDPECIAVGRRAARVEAAERN